MMGDVAGKRKRREPTAPAWLGAVALDKALERLEISNVELAREVGVNYTTISRYRSGDRAPSPDHLAKMCKYANLSVDEVLGIKPPSPVDPRIVKRVVAVAEALLKELRALAGDDAASGPGPRTN